MGTFDLFEEEKEAPQTPMLSEDEVSRQVNDHIFRKRDFAAWTDAQARQLALFIRFAQTGDIVAMYNCGVMYSHGAGTPPDGEKALCWYEKAAEQGLAEAQLACGIMYRSGVGTAADKKKALYWCEKAAEQGLAKAQYTCGIMYRNSEGTKAGDSYFSDVRLKEDEEDEEKALYWFKKAAEQGLAEAQLACGEMYERGIGTQADMFEAYRWYMKAFEQDDADALRKYEEYRLQWGDRVDSDS